MPSTTARCAVGIAHGFRGSRVFAAMSVLASVAPALATLINLGEPVPKAADLDEHAPVLALGVDMPEELDEEEDSLTESGSKRFGRNPYGEQVTYDHMPKAGGTYLEYVIRHAIGRHRFALLEEFDHITAEAMSDTFVIGSVRNPCDYYLSLWAYGVDKGGKMQHHVPDYDALYVTETEDKSSEADIQTFRNWVKAVNTEGFPGVMSVRFAHSYSRAAWNVTDDDAFLPPVALPKDTLKNVEDSMQTFNKSDVDCWILAENMDEDLNRCLSTWSTNTGKQIHWDELAEAKASADHWTSSHAPCNVYFDNETEAAVRASERSIFNLFGYNTCCA